MSLLPNQEEILGLLTLSAVSALSLDSDFCEHMFSNRVAQSFCFETFRYCHSVSVSMKSYTYTNALVSLASFCTFSYFS